VRWQYESESGRPRDGETKEAWVVNYRDKAKGGSRVQRTFPLKTDADAFVVDMKGERRDGIPIARSKSVTEADNLEHGTG
jgi:integrase